MNRSVRNLQQPLGGHMNYIYESPDGGKTVYRHPFGFPDKRELVGKVGEPIVIEGLVIHIEEHCSYCGSTDQCNC